MKDWQFYPIAIFVICAMVIFAMTRGQHEVLEQGADFRVEGQSLNTLYAAEGVSFSIAGDAVNPNSYAVLSAHVSRANAPPSAGVFVTLTPAYRQAFAGKELRITIRARKGRATPLDSFDIAYLSEGVAAGSSGWRTFPLSNEFEDISFTYTPKNTDGAPGTDYVGIWPDVEGNGRTMDVKFIKVAVVSSATP